MIYQFMNNNYSELLGYRSRLRRGIKLVHHASSLNTTIILQKIVLR